MRTRENHAAIGRAFESLSQPVPDALFDVVKTRTGEMYDGPFRSMFAAASVAGMANAAARRDGRPAVYFHSKRT